MENRRADDGIPEDFALGFEALIADEPDADSPPAAAPVWRAHGTPPSSVIVASRARSREHHLVTGCHRICRPRRPARASAECHTGSSAAPY